MSLTEIRRQRAQKLAAQLGLEGESLYKAAVAVWSNLNPQITSFDTALSAAAAALSSWPAQPDRPVRAAGGTPDSPRRDVAVIAPDGAEHRFTVTGDDNMTILVDGEPVLGVDQHGPGRWYGEQWQRLHSADSITERSVAIEGITTEGQWRDLEAALGLNPWELGRFKPWAADRPKIISGQRYDVEAAVAWARRNGLAYEDEQCVRTDARPRP